MITIEYKSLKFKMQGFNEEGVFEGYASTRSKDLVGDIVEEGAFKRTIDHTGGKVPILFFHDPMQPIGMTDYMEEDAKGLYCKGMIDMDTEIGRKVCSGMRKGYIDRMSIGYNTIQEDYNREMDARMLKEVKLLECSMITKNFAANEDALLTRVKSFAHQKDLSPSVIRSTIKALENLLANSSEDTWQQWDSSNDTPEIKKVIGNMKLPLAPKDRTWNSGEAQKRIWDWAGGADFKPSKASQAFFYVDENKPNNRTAYKLPFADVIDGELKAIPRAIFAVAGVLEGARGGVDMSGEEQDKVKRRVSTYYRRMRDEFDDPAIIPPWDKSKAIDYLLTELKRGD